MASRAVLARGRLDGYLYLLVTYSAPVCVDYGLNKVSTLIAWHAGAVLNNSGDIQSATTIGLDLIRLSNWSGELICTVLDMMD